MCGIVGKIGREATKANLEGMLKVAGRRGPEGANLATTGDGVVGHTSLAFVNEGNNPQPLTENGNTVVFNGEIYNWQDLSRKYGMGASTDTQVLLRGLSTKGPEFLKEIDGQFAYISKIGGRTHVGRDKWGISPIVYGRSRDGMTIASTAEALMAGGVTSGNVRTVPAGSFGEVVDGEMKLGQWFRLPQYDVSEQERADPAAIRTKAIESVRARIPERQNILFTAMGGIDSQFVTASTARATNGNFGGAITVVPWNPSRPDDVTGGDYKEARATIEMLKAEGIDVNHYAVPLGPEQINEGLDRVAKVCGPDGMNLLCALAEDLVATTARRHGGKAIMTAGGPDEAGWSYKPWTMQHRKDLERGFYAVGDQFASSEGVRAGLVFGEQGLENRVPLAFLIEDARKIRAEDKQQVEDWGTGNPFSIKMRDKIFWREAIGDLLPAISLAKPKEAIHSASGTKVALAYLAQSDAQYQHEKDDFLRHADSLGWDRALAGFNPRLDEATRAGQGYALWRWARQMPEVFDAGASQYFGFEKGAKNFSFSDKLADKARRPICYDWSPVAEVIA